MTKAGRTITRNMIVDLKIGKKLTMEDTLSIRAVDMRRETL